MEAGGRGIEAGSAELVHLYASGEGASRVSVRAGRISVERKGSLFATAYVPRFTRSGVVVCPPFGTEGELARRTLHELGLTLAERGLFVLTPHLFGQGQSEGDLRDARLDRWCAELARCIRYVAATTGGETPALVGARFGAVLAVLAARRVAVDAMVLWDPLFDVPGVFRASKRAGRIRKRLRTPAEDSRRGEDESGLVELEGHAVGRAFYRELLALEWEAASMPWRSRPQLVGLAISGLAKAKADAARRVRSVFPEGVFEVFDPSEPHGRYWSRIGVARQTGLIEWTAELLGRP